MPFTPAADEVHAEKYRSPGETFDDAMLRVAGVLADDTRHFDAFYDAIREQRFLPAGRVQSAVGSARHVTPYNCYVSGTIEDSFVDGSGSIMDRAAEAARTMRMGGGIGYDFSTLRPRGALIKTLQSQSSGPLGFMPIFDAVCQATSSSGNRRGAQMGVLRVDHPDIEEFIAVKQEIGKLTGFNLSIAVTDQFMMAAKAGAGFDLSFNGEVYKTVDAGALWESVMQSTWDWAEPGVLFIDRINQMNNLWYCETIAATNPCGEQPLPPFGACLLGSFNLTKYAFRLSTGVYGFDWVQYKDDIAPVVRAMDNVVDYAKYPLPAQEIEAKNKRRMGLGITGLANMAEAMGYPYGSEAFLKFEAKVLEVLRDESYMTSALLALEKGPFPLYDARYLDGQFIKTLPWDIQDTIRRYGIRNSHLTSIAPTGTISLCADNVSSSIEPVFSYSTKRVRQTPDGPVVMDIEDYGVSFFGKKGKQTSQVTAKEHVAVLSTAQRFVDSSVSKTCNVSGTMPWDDFKAIYTSAWEMGAKGCTTFNQDGKRLALLVAALEAQPEDQSCRIDLETGKRECA